MTDRTVLAPARPDDVAAITALVRMACEPDTGHIRRPPGLVDNSGRQVGTASTGSSGFSSQSGDQDGTAIGTTERPSQLDPK